MRSITITYPGITLDKLQKEYNKTTNKRLAVRLLALIKICQGFERLKIAQFLNCSRASIHNWLRRVNRQGLSGLNDLIGKGLKSQLTNDQKQQLAQALTKSPKTFGFPTNLWTGKVLREHIKRQYGVTYQQAMGYVIFRELGFTLQRPTRKYLGAKQDKRKEFKAQLKKNQRASFR